LTIVEPDADTCRGQLRVRGVDWDNARAQLLIWLAPQFRGQGLGRRALRVAGDWLLGPCQMARLEMFSELDNAALMIAAGAAGYLLKNSQPAELARAIRAAHAGEAIIDPTVAARLMHALSESDHPRRDTPALEQLTNREREVLTLITNGRSNKRIALELGISEKTVKAHVGHVLAKLGVSDRTQAAVLAVQEGLVQRS